MGAPWLLSLLQFMVPQESLYSLALSFYGESCKSYTLMEKICTTACLTFSEFERAACLESKSREQLSLYSQPYLWLPQTKTETPLPLIILLPGSSGTWTRTMMTRKDYWLEHNYAVMILDSFTKRRALEFCLGSETPCVDYEPASSIQNNNQTLANLPDYLLLKARQKMLKAATTGHYLLPAERVADLHLALDVARSDKRINSDNIHLIGFSHGGTTVLDALTMETIDEIPPTMNEKALRPLSGIRSASVYYPNCGVGTYFYQHQVIPYNIPVLMAVARYDEFVSPSTCIGLSNDINAEFNAWNYRSKYLVTLRAYLNYHAFDMSEAEKYDPVAAEELQKDVYDFISSHTPAQP